MTNQSMFTRELLEAMKRTDLQRVCKERGLKANLRTEAMIELLLDSPPSQSPRRPSRHRAPSTRGVGRQVSSTRSRLHSTSTMIVHSDTDDDDRHHAIKPESEAPSVLHPGPMTRTRKARDAQLRLGVGRPTVAGGRGPRTVTRSVSVAKGTRSRSGRGAKPTLAPTAEGTPDEATLPPSSHATPQSRTIENGRIRRASSMDMNTDQAGVRAIVEEQVRPLQRTVASLEGQLQQQASAHAQELAALNDRVLTIMNELRELRRQAESIQLLRSSMEQLQTELSHIRHSRGSEPPHDPTNFSSATIPSDGPSHTTNVRAHRPTEPSRHSRAPRSSPAFEYPPPPATSPTKPPSRDVPMHASILGKRQRSADTWDATAVSGTDQEDTADKESRTSVHRQSRKRAKMEQSTDETHEAPLAGPSNTTAHGRPENAALRDGPSTETMVSGQPDPPLTEAVPEQPPRDRVVGDVIFTDQDFDFFDNPTNLHPADSQLGTTQAVEDQRPFSFAFPAVIRTPVVSTPDPTGSLPDPSSSPTLNTLPYPERPHSPSPAPMPHRAVVTRSSQNDAYRPFGFPPESRNPPGSSAPQGSAIDPASLLRTPPHVSHDLPSLDSDPIDGRRRRASSNDVGAGLGMTTVPTRGEDVPAALVRRTMYGTELEGDTRFGDFGVEGVATGFWTGTRF